MSHGSIGCLYAWRGIRISEPAFAGRSINMAEGFQRTISITKIREMSTETSQDEPELAT